jgi:hypothetical protein
MKFWKVGLIVTVVFFLIGLITLLAIWSTFMNTVKTTNATTNSLNADGENRMLYRVSFSGAGTKTLRVNVPTNACAKAVNYSVLPTDDNISATIDVGVTSGAADFGAAEIDDVPYDDPDATGAILASGGTASISELCSMNSTAQLFFTVEVTSTGPVTFLFEVVSQGYFVQLNA